MSEPYSVVSTERSVAAAREMIAENKTWFIVLGIALMLVGAGAIAFPFVTTVAAKVVIGWLFLFGGLSQVVHAFSIKNWSEFFLSLLIGILYIIAGGWLAFFPLTGILTLTLVLSALFLAEGIIKTSMAFRWKPREGWGWILLSGVVSVFVGGLILAGLPSTATWAIGLLVGINLMMAGLSYLILTMAVSEQS